jgi:hypothetical protein
VDRLESTFTQFARTPVVGRPFTISEVNHPFPHEYACEGFPILTAYALFRDWDGIYWFTRGRGRPGKTDDGIPRNRWLDFSVDPMKLATLHACALVLTSLDGKPIRRAQRLLLLATSRATNTDSRWEDDRQTVAEWGHGPVRIEPVTGSVTLRELGKVRGLRARPLSPVGQPLERDLPTQFGSSGWRLGLGEPATTWVQHFSF